MTIDLSTDVTCTSLEETSVTLGAPASVDSKDPTAVTAQCSVGTIGSLVAIPATEPDAEVSFKVVTSIDNNAVATCDVASDAPLPDYCIVARRTLRFVPNTPLLVPIVMRGSCAGIHCDDTETCVDGLCAPALIDPAKCRGEDGCGEDDLDPGTKPDPDPDPDPPPGWTTTFSSSSPPTAYTIAVGPTGTVYVAGSLNGPTTFGNTVLEGARGFLVALDGADGTVLWAQHLLEPVGAESFDSDAYGVAVDALDNLYVVGRFAGQALVDGNVVAASNGGVELGYLLKLDANGQYLDHVIIAPFAGVARPYLVAVCDNTVIVAGNMAGPLVWGEEEMYLDASLPDVYVLAFDTTELGDLWQRKVYGEGGARYVAAINVGSDGDVLLGGVFEGDVAFGQEYAVAVGDKTDIFIVRIPDAQAMTGKLTTWRGPGRNLLTSLTTGPGGALCGAGSFEQTLEVVADVILEAQPGTTSAFAACLGTATTPSLSAAYPTSDRADVQTLAYNPSRDAFLMAGTFSGDVDVSGEKTKSGGLIDLFVGRLDQATFAPSDLQFLGGSGNDAVYHGTVDSNGNEYLLGSAGGEVDFGFGKLGTSAGLFVNKEALTPPAL